MPGAKVCSLPLKVAGSLGRLYFEEANCQSGLVRSARSETQSFKIPQYHGEEIKSETRETGLHLFALSSGDTITSDVCRLRLQLCSSLVPVYPWEISSGRCRLRQARTHKDHFCCVPSVLKQLLLTKPISAFH